MRRKCRIFLKKTAKFRFLLCIPDFRVKLVSSTRAAAASPVRDTPYKELDTIPEVECPPPHAVPLLWHVPAEACMRSRLAPTGHPPTARG